MSLYSISLSQCITLQTRSHVAKMKQSKKTAKLKKNHEQAFRVLPFFYEFNVHYNLIIQFFFVILLFVFFFFI